MIALLLLAILAIVFFGLGFTIQWLFVLAVIFALVWLISFFRRRARRPHTRVLVVTNGERSAR